MPRKRAGVTLGAPAMPANVLIVDDDANVRRALRRGLETAGFSVAEAADGFDALDKEQELSPAVIVLDLRMPRMNGIEVAAVLRQRFSKSKVLLLSIYDIGETLASASGICAVVAKTDGLNKVIDRVRELAARPENSAN